MLSTKFDCAAIFVNYLMNLQGIDIDFNVTGLLPVRCPRMKKM
jgi:hypothetical protein